MRKIKKTLLSFIFKNLGVLISHLGLFIALFQLSKSDLDVVARYIVKI